MFSDMSGLHINNEKSVVFFGGVKLEDQAKISSILGFPIGDLPLKYLGLPMGDKRLLVQGYYPLIARITTHIQSWTVKSLSYAGPWTGNENGKKNPVTWDRVSKSVNEGGLEIKELLS